MSERVTNQLQKAKTSQVAPKDTISLQRRDTKLPEQNILSEQFFEGVSATFAEPRFGYDFSRVPVHTNITSQMMPLMRTQPMVQRLPKDVDAGFSTCATCPESESTENSTVTGSASEAIPQAAETIKIPWLSETTEETSIPEEIASSGLIVEDSAEEVSPGQMRKSEFLAQLRTEVCQTVETAIAETGQTTDSCPYIGHWFDIYSRKDSAHLERAICKYAPDASSVTTASGYISSVTQRARHSAETWARTGEITGVPEGIPIELPGTSLLGGLVSGIGGIFFKACEGGAKLAGDPQTIQTELGEGQPLDSGVRSRMASAFGIDFANVRTHTDGRAAGLSNRMNARAFTVGEHITFGAGEYKPGTLKGDALIAHELAHVIQQQWSTNSPEEPLKIGSEEQRSLEMDSDKSAVGVVVALWGQSMKRLTGIGQQALPRLKSGLHLQRCGAKQPQLINPRDFQHRFDGIMREVLGRVARSDEQTHSLVEIEFDILWNDYQEKLQDAGSNQEQIARAQQSLLESLRKMHEAIERRLEMTRIYGIQFIAGSTQITQNPSRHRIRVWSREELEKIDTILRRVPTDYLGNIRYFVRKPGEAPQRTAGEPSTIAGWDQRQQAINIYDPFFRGSQYIFDSPEDRRFRYFLHEIGHSTVTERRVDSFFKIPPPEWMELSDWQLSTRENLRTDWGFQYEDLDLLDEDKRQRVRRPRLIRNRYVIFDKYEPNNPEPPQQFVHYAAQHNDEFVSPYAKVHPAEDLAESFAHYLQNSDTTRRKLDVGRRGVMDKWDFLVRNYPERLIQSKSKVNQFRDRYEREADRMADAVMDTTVRKGLLEYEKSPDMSFADKGIQCQHSSEIPTPLSALVTTESNTIPIPERTSSRVLIVEDENEELEAGQMQKDRFLAELRTAICSAADSELAGTGRTTNECPYLARWFNYYRERTPQQVEQAIHRYAPDTKRASSAREYIPIVTKRVTRSVERWAQTGEITGLPEGMAPGLLGMGLSGITGGFLSGIASFGASLLQGSGRLFSGISGILFKSRHSDTEEVDNPEVIQSELGEGRFLESGIRLRMESAFGTGFSQVRIHTDNRATELSNRFNARAFTLGKHIAFGPGEYKPNTLVGDALIAHEMTHVVQQGAATTSSTPMAKGAVNENSIEEEADLSAINAVTSLLSGVNGKISQIRTSALPRLKSGLKLQRCATTRSQLQVQVQSLTDLASITPWQLSQVSDEQFNRLSGSRTRSGEPGIEDYRRARQLFQAVFLAYKVTFDIDNPPSTPFGRVPTPRELRILDANLTQILGSSGGSIRRLVSGPGGRGVPTRGASRTPTLEGKVRITRTLGEFVAKRYQLEMLVSSGLRQNNALLDREVTVLWRQFGIQPGSSPRITDQERRVAIFKLLEVNAAGFYYPPDDIIYFPPSVNLRKPAVRDIARHETVHLLGGRERTRQAFVTRFGTDNYIRYWEPFEEGMTELLSQESRPVGQSTPTPTIETYTEASGSSNTTVTVEAGGSQYEQYVQWLRRLMTLESRNRDMLLQAFFSGNISENVFQLLIRNPPPIR